MKWSASWLEFLALRGFCSFWCEPVDQNELHLLGEWKTIQDCTKIKSAGLKVEVELLPAATIMEFHRILREKNYDIVHFSGHSDSKTLVFEKDDGTSTAVPLSAIAELINQTPSVKCVVLNSCESAKDLADAMSPLTVGMQKSITDVVAQAFTRGFYDAVARGVPFNKAFEEGVLAVKLAGHKADHIRLLERNAI